MNHPQSKYHVKSFFLRITALLGLVFFLLGMGGGNGNTTNQNQIPLPEVNFSAVLIDSQGVQTQAHRLTWEGKNYLKGQYGTGTITVPFSKVRMVRVQSGASAGNNLLNTDIQFKSGKTIQLGIERTTKIFADTDFGQYEVFIKDLQRLDFQ